MIIKMRKALIGIQALLVLALTGCLKDERYEDQQMGITVTDIPAVALTQASKSPVVQGITAVSGAAVVDGPIITLEASHGASNDVHITLAYDQSLVTAAGLTPLPAGTFSLSTLTPVIAAGSNSVQDLKLTITNSTALDPSKTYGVGIRIASVDQGYQIAGNGKTVIFALAIKNRYDGIYELTLRLDGWAAYGIGSGVADVYPADVHLITSGPNAVVTNIPDLGSSGPLQPGWTGGQGSISGYTVFGAAEPKYFFDLATDKVTSVLNLQPDDGRGRAFLLDPASTTSAYNPTTKEIKIEYFLKQNGRPDMKITAVFKYLGPRP